MAFINENINIIDFITDEEDCIEKVKQGALMFADGELAKKIPHEIYCSLSHYALGFFEACYDRFGNVYLPDQIDPEKVTEHIELEKKPELDHDTIYALVCRKQQKAINDLYKRMKHENCIGIRIHSLDEVNIKKVEEDYHKLYMSRKRQNPKRVRCAQVL